MTKLAYALLVMFSGFSVGCAIIGAVISTRLARRGAQMSRHAVPLLVGVIFTQGILLIRLVQIGSTSSAGLEVWLYLLGLAIQSFGLLSTTAFAASRLADYEAQGGVHDEDKS